MFEVALRRRAHDRNVTFVPSIFKIRPSFRCGASDRHYCALPRNCSKAYVTTAKTCESMPLPWDKPSMMISVYIVIVAKSTAGRRIRARFVSPRNVCFCLVRKFTELITPVLDRHGNVAIARLVVDLNITSLRCRYRCCGDQFAVRAWSFVDGQLPLDSLYPAGRPVKAVANLFGMMGGHARVPRQRDLMIIRSRRHLPRARREFRVVLLLLSYFRNSFRFIPGLGLIGSACSEA